MSGELPERMDRRLLSLSRTRRAQVAQDLVDEEPVDPDRFDGIEGAVEDYVREDEYLRTLLDAVDALLDLEEETRRRESLSPELARSVESAVVAAESELSDAVETRADEVADSVRDECIDMIQEEWSQ